MDWKQNKKKIICNEIGIIIVLVIIILLGITINIFANNGLFLKTENMENISSVLLQIQGTLITITIAVVAILSGVINESYMGISISSYYLEKRPFVLKYKFIIVLEFVLLTASVIFHFISLYYVVFAIFVVTLIFIVASIFEVFEFFKGTKGTTDEIERYVEYRLEKGNDYLKYGNQFLIDWKKDSANQSTEEYEKHLKMFFKLIDRLLYLEDIKNVNSLSEKVSLFLLRDYSKANQLKGLLFICEYYKHICDWIDDNPEKASNINDQIHLIDKVYKKWYSVFSSYDPETIENVVNFRRLSENVIRVAASIGYDENISKSEPHAVYGLAGILGHYIKMQLRKGEAFDLAKWGYILYDYYSCFISGIPEKTKDFYSESLAIRDFNICKGYLLNEQINLVQNAIFLDGLGRLYTIRHQSVVLKIMLIHGFMYYLAFRENTDCIDEKIQEEIKNKIMESEIVKSVAHFYYRLSEEPKYLTSELENRFEYLLEENELYPLHTDGKELVMHDASREYFLFAILFVARHSLKPKKILEILDIDNYYVYLIDFKYKILRERFIEMYSIFDDVEHRKEQQIKNVEEMLMLFSAVMKDKYKRNVIISAEQNQHIYDDNKVEEKVKNEIKKTIMEKANILFEPFNKPVKRLKKYKKINVYSCLDYTIGLERDFGRADINYPFGFFTTWLINELSNKYGLKTVNRNRDFKTDEEFRRFLIENKYNYLFGSMYSFDCKDFLEYKKHIDFLNDQICVFVPYSKNGYATKEGALFIHIDDVNVEIISPTIENVNISKNEETGLLIYSPSDGVKLEFKEDELRDFIHNERKIVNVYFDFTIGIKIDSKKKNAVIISRKAFEEELKEIN